MTHLRVPKTTFTDSRAPALADKYPHYYRRIPAGVTHLDVHRVVDLFQVKRSAVGHAIKKLLCSGLRGSKSEAQDLREARELIDRQLEMIEEEQGLADDLRGTLVER